VDHHALLGDFLQDDEMVEIPVQDAGHPELRQVLEVKLHRARVHLQRVRHLDQVAERRSLDRHQEKPAHRGNIGLEAMIAGDHRQRGEAALGRLRLQHQRQLATEAERQVFKK
jgi:hypothetical protein